MATGEQALPEAPPLPADLCSAQGFDMVPREHFEPIKLHFAINHDNFEEAQSQIQRGVDLDFVVHGNTPLMLALLREQYNIARLLVLGGADVTIPEIYAWGRQPLHLAARDGRADFVDLLLHHGASTQAADGMLMTPLHWAAAHGSLDVVKLLLDHGAHVNVRDDRGRTPLFRAACFNHTEIVCRLREEGAAIDSQDVFGWSPLHQAALCSLPVVTELLALGANPNLQNLRGDTPLHLVVSRQAPHNLLTLSRTDLQFYTRDLKITSTCTDRQKSFLSDRDLLLLLLDYGCDINVKNSDGKTPFDDAVTNSNVMFIRWLVLAGAKMTLPVSTFPDGWPPGLITNSTLCDFLRIAGANRVCTLQDLCRSTIRKSLYPILSTNIQLLPIPNTLQKFLLISLETLG